MDWKGIGKKVFEAAPLIGTVLGGPAGGAVGSVVSMVGSALGLEPDETTPKAVDALLMSDPDALLKLKQAEMDHKVELQKLALETDRVFLADRSDARSREVEITKVTEKRDATLIGLAWLVVIGFFTVMVLLMYKGIAPESSSEVVYLLIGALTTGFGTVLAYFFGSSKGSADKTATLANRR